MLSTHGSQQPINRMVVGAALSQQMSGKDVDGMWSYLPVEKDKIILFAERWMELD